MCGHRIGYSSVAEEFFISDQHYGHANILKFTGEDGMLIRPGFESVEHMDELMIARHNSVVKDGDRVYMLGDFVWGKDGTEARIRMRDIIRRLKGDIRLIPGNHDDIRLGEYGKYFDGFQSWKQFGDRNPRFIACHYPLHICNLRYEVRNKSGENGWKEWFNVHGHIHQRRVLDDKGLPDPRYINVSVECIDYTPVHIDELIK
jgi:calcineurin-like phosphoesterase family protein